MLRKSPGFTAAVVLTLALSIGANTAIFGFLDRILLRPLPVKKPHELVMMKFRSGNYTGDSFVYPFYLDLRSQSDETFSGFMAYSLVIADLSTGDSVREVCGMAVSSDYFSVLGVKPAVGRGFLAGEDRAPGDYPVVVISHELWLRQFHGDPNVLGKTIRLNDYPLTVVGVAPSEFTGTCAGIGPAVYVPLSMWAYIKDISLEKRFYDWLHVLARLKPGVSPEQAQAALRVSAERIYAVRPTNSPTEIIVADGSRGTNIWTDESLWWPFALLQAVTALVLVVACANVANMLLARGTTRQKELAIRRAMGASRVGIVRQLLTESTLLAMLSGVCGVLLAHWLSVTLRSSLTIASATNIPIGVDGRIVIFALLGSLSSVLLFGLVPALQVSRSDPMTALKEGTGVITVLGGRWSLRNFLVIGQVAVSVIVLAFGVLCVRSLGKLRVVDPGFDPAKVIGVSIDFERGPAVGLDAQQFCADLKERISAYPGVQSVSLASQVPLSGGGRNKTSAKRIEDYQIPPDLEYVSWEYANVGPGYFQTLGVPVLQGRDFSLRDGPGAPKVMIVNDLLAQRYWPNQNPIGKRITFVNEVREVVGVVKATRLYSLAEEPVPLSYWPLAQPMESTFVSKSKPVLLIRTDGDPKVVISMVRKELDSAGLSPAVYDVRSVAEQAWDVLLGQRMIAGILNIVGSVGLLFVATGIFSMMAYEVGRRTREIGIRMALGAEWSDVRVLILRKGALLTFAGLGLGIGLSFVPLWFLGLLLPEIRMWDAYFLYGVHVWDPLTYVGVALLVAFVAVAACWLPARRAAKIDPMAALRYE